jgi:drug/metabolite transporter (DMT)-like permease
MEAHRRGYFLALAAVVLWSTVASAFKLTLRHVDHVQLLFYSSLFSTAILGVILVAQRKLRPAMSCTRRQYGRSLLLGILNPTLYYLILFKAYDLLPAQEAQPLNYTWGLTLPLLSVPLLGQRLRGRDIGALLLGYAGVVVISTHGNPLSFRLSDPLGVALALGSAFVWALYWIYNLRDDRDPVVCLFLSFLFALPLTAIACATLSTLQLPGVEGLIGMAYTGAFEMSVTFVLWLSALKLAVNTARVSTLIFASPFLSLVFIHFTLGESILPSTVGGLALIVAALVLQRIGGRKKQDRPAGNR